MRNLILFVLILFVFACSDSKKNIKIGEDPQVGNLMDGKTKAAFDGLKAEYKSMSASIKARGAFTCMDSPPFIVIRDMDSLDVEVMPYYDFDQEKFYKDPSPENILKSLSKPDDKVYFAVKKNSVIMYSLMAAKKDGEWKFDGLSEDWGKVIGWLPSRLAEAGTTSYKIFRPCGLEYVVYERAGKPVFCRITGEEVKSAEKLCESLVNIMTRSEEDWKYLQELEKNLPEKYRKKR